MGRLGLLLCSPLCPACFLGCDNPSAGSVGHSLAGTDRNNLLSLDLCPPRPLSSRNSLAPRSRNSSRFASRSAPMQVDVSESGQGDCNAVQFILKSFAFLLEFADYRLHQCFWHEASYHSLFTTDPFREESPVTNREWKQAQLSFYWVGLRTVLSAVRL